MVVENDQIYYLHSDHIGRPRFATDAAGLTVWQANYLPFGKLHVTTGNNPDLRFPGQWFQAESGLFQNWMRDYDPTLGRYLQADPLGLVDGPSLYVYVRQNPQRFVAPRGEFRLPLPVPRGGPRAGGLADDILPPPPFVPSVPLPDVPIDDPKAQAEHDQYKNFCDGLNRPPKTGMPCLDLLNEAQWHQTCADKMREWDQRWNKSGWHTKAARERANAARKLMMRFNRMRCNLYQSACFSDEDVLFSAMVPG